MKDKVFIGWSGNNEIALKTKKLLEESYNYICYVGGNADNTSSFASVGDAVIQQMKTCNQAIIIFQNRNDFGVSNNLFFELGYVLAKYGVKKIHCVKKSSETIALPSDFDNSFVEPLKYEDDNQFTDAVVKYFLGRQKLSINENKMVIINNRYRVHDMIQIHYSDKGSICSDYELAQYVLFYVQASRMFNDEKKVYEELLSFNRLHSHEFSSELRQAVTLSLAHLHLITSLKSNANGDIYVEMETFNDFSKTCFTLLDEIVDDDGGTFDEWIKVFIYCMLSYCYDLYSNSPDAPEEIIEELLQESIALSTKGLEAIRILEESTPCIENNDSIGLVSLLKAYTYRDLFLEEKLLHPDDYETWMKWLELSKKERSALLRNYSMGSIDSKLYDSFRLEYFLSIGEYIRFARPESISKLELHMMKSELKRFIDEYKKKTSSSDIYFTKLTTMLEG